MRRRSGHWLAPKSAPARETQLKTTPEPVHPNPLLIWLMRCSVSLTCSPLSTLAASDLGDQTYLITLITCGVCRGDNQRLYIQKRPIPIIARATCRTMQAVQ